LKFSIPNRWLPLFGIALALLLLAGAVLHTRNLLRGELRAQLARRDASLLAGLLEQRLQSTDAEGLSDTLVAVLETAQLRSILGVMSVRFFDTNGTCSLAIPPGALEADLEPDDVLEVQHTGMVSRFRFVPDLEDEFLLAPLDPPSALGFPILEVVLPLPEADGQPAGLVRFLMKADSLADEYAALETTLRRQAWIGFGLAGLAMTVALAFVFHRLAETQRDLMRANRELTLAAKTAAVGAVMSHLLHGLKNPLAGLQQFMNTQAGTSTPEPDTDWSDAADATRRMRRMIDDVTRLLREDSGLVSYEIPIGELIHLLVLRVIPLAKERGVKISAKMPTTRSLPNRTANMVLLILENLTTNALQATPEGRRVQVVIEENPHWTAFRVIDEGPGLPADVRSRLFTPLLSTKANGTGLGLALSRQLARILGADLELERTGPSEPTPAAGRD
jgi:signal transduction histidine kinase